MEYTFSFFFPEATNENKSQTSAKDIHNPLVIFAQKEVDIHMTTHNIFLSLNFSTGQEVQK